MPEPGMAGGLLRLVPAPPAARGACAVPTRVGVAGREAVGAGRCLPDAGCGAAPSGRGKGAPARGAGRRREPTLSRPAPRKGPSESTGRATARRWAEARAAGGGAAPRGGAVGVAQGVATVEAQACQGLRALRPAWVV